MPKKRPICGNPWLRFDEEEELTNDQWREKYEKSLTKSIQIIKKMSEERKRMKRRFLAVLVILSIVIIILISYDIWRK